MKTAITIKRVYDEAAPADGYRILVDRIWPRGLTKEKAHIDEWDKTLAPSTALRKWFNHEPGRWEEFRKRYAAELGKLDVASFLEKNKGRKKLTLVYGAKDREHNQAVVMKEFLEKRLD